MQISKSRRGLLSFCDYTSFDSMNMDNFNTLVTIFAAITLFIYGLQSFGKEIQSFGADKLSKWIKKFTQLPLGGFLLGGVVTAIIQSSTLVSSLTVTMVNAGIITFRDSLLILLGANIGTTSTAWIVSFDNAMFGPLFIALGSVLSMLPWRIKVFGKSIFYFGFIFFSLSLISYTMEPIKNNPLLIDILAKATNPMLGVLYGIAVTVIVQSSSVVVGLVIVLVQQGVLGLDAAIPIVVGANVGTTSTALLVSLKMNSMSKLVALSASLFNLVGVLLILPFFGVLEDFVTNSTQQVAFQVAIAYTISNTITSLFFLVLLKPTVRLLHKTPWYKRSMEETILNTLEHH